MARHDEAIPMLQEIRQLERAFLVANKEQARKQNSRKTAQFPSSLAMSMAFSHPPSIQNAMRSVPMQPPQHIIEASGALERPNSPILADGPQPAGQNHSKDASAQGGDADTVGRNSFRAWSRHNQLGDRSGRERPAEPQVVEARAGWQAKGAETEGLDSFELAIDM